MSEENVIAKKYILIIVVVAIINFTIGGILLLLGFNIVFNVMFDGNVLLYTIFNAISYIGDDLILIIIVASVLIFYDMKFGKNLGLSLLGSVYLNSVLKDIWKDPRPYTNYGQETSYGFPSAHAQNAFASWGLIGYEAYRKKKNVIVLICFIFIYLIGISRIVIGVHDLEDIWGVISLEQFS